MLKQLNRETTAATTLPVKVLQFGEGNFLRAFADWIIDILNERTDFNGSVQIIQPLASGMGDALNRQDGLYHVVLNGIKHDVIVKETRLITCVKGVINPYNDFEEYLNQASNPDLRFIISNTTEAGIAFSGKDMDPDRLAETFPGKLTTLLHRRFQFFSGSPESGLIFLPCELIDRNGEQLRTAILAYIKQWNLSDSFREWINQHNIFCNTLVDRIVPGFPADSIHEIQKETGYEDRLVVKAEPFHLWVIEGPSMVSELFPAGKANLDVKFVDDLAPYRTRKVRILNGAHTAMVPIAYLKGIRTVQETIEDTDTGTFVTRVIDEEIIPTLDLPLEELKSFAASVLERFRNPFIRHELISIALNSVSKFKVRVLPSLVEYVKRKGKLPSLLVKSLASLICFYKGEVDGVSIPLNDSPDVLSTFQKAWSEPHIKQTVQEILRDETLWETDLTKLEGLTEAVIRDVKTLMNVRDLV